MDYRRCVCSEVLRRLLQLSFPRRRRRRASTERILLLSIEKATATRARPVFLPLPRRRRLMMRRRKKSRTARKKEKKKQPPPVSWERHAKGEGEAVRDLLPNQVVVVVVLVLAVLVLVVATRKGTIRAAARTRAPTPRAPEVTRSFRPRIIAPARQQKKRWT